MDDDDEEAGQNKNVSKRNVSIDNYIAWGILQVIFSISNRESFSIKISL